MKKSKQKRRANKNQEENFFVPSEILRTFKNLFPEVEPISVGWEWEVPNKIYEAEFEYEGKEYEVEITVTGHHLLTEIEISVEEVPENIRKACTKKFRGWSIDEAEKVVYGNGDIYYEFELNRELETEELEKEVLFREDGLYFGEEE